MSEQDQTPAEKRISPVDPKGIESPINVPLVLDGTRVPESSEEKQVVPEFAHGPLSSPSVSKDDKEPNALEAERENPSEVGTNRGDSPRSFAKDNVDRPKLNDPVVVLAQMPEEDSHPESESQAQLAAADAAVLAESRRHTRRSFVVAAVGAAAGYGLYRWIDRSPGDEMQPEALRRLFQANAAVAREVFKDHALAPTYPLKAARDLRVNGIYGLKKMLVAESWRLQLVGARHAPDHSRFTNDVTAWEYKYMDADSHVDQGHDTKVDPNMKTAGKMAPAPMLDQAKAEEDHAGRMPRGTEEAGESYSTLKPQTPGLLLTMEDILKLPRHELVTQFKCIEGWSQIVHWAGVRMADFIEAYPPELIDWSTVLLTITLPVLPPKAAI